MSNFAETHDEHVRLAILRLLDDANDYSSNDSVLHSALQGFGLSCTRQQVRGHLEWLEEQRTVTLLRPSTLIVATITESGIDIAKGRSRRSGIARRSPGD